MTRTKSQIKSETYVFFQKFWLTCKKNWGYFVAAFGVAITFLLLKKEKTSLLDQINVIRESYEDQIKQIESARREEREKNAKALELLQKRLEDVQKQYEKAKIELDKKKKEEIKELMEKYSNDPETLAKKLSEATGFKVILPE
jgi:hypothetical protein